MIYCTIDIPGGGFKYVLCSPLFGEDDPSLTDIFQMGWFNHQPVYLYLVVVVYRFILDL